MGQTREIASTGVGNRPQRIGAWHPISWGLVAVLGLAGCSNEEETFTRHPVVLGMTSDVAASYDDGELQLFEVKRPVSIEVIQPSRAEQRSLNQHDLEPYGQQLWVKNEDVRVQLTWTLSNLDAESHVVALLIDPWNELGRYWPGFQVVDEEDGELMPNFSGIEHLYELPGTASGEDSRITGTYTFEDMHELAVDFATVINIILNPPPADGDGPDQVVLANHAFHPENRSHDDPLIARYIPTVIPGLVGFDLGLRTMEPANLAVEVVVEVVDTGMERVRPNGELRLVYTDPSDYWTVGIGGP